MKKSIIKTTVIADKGRRIAPSVTVTPQSAPTATEQVVQQKKLRLIIGSFSVDCRSEEIDPMTKGMLMMWGVFSEMERDIISQRAKSGMKNAAAKGKRIGRPKTTTDMLPDKFWKYYRMYKNKEITVSECAKLMKCSRTTIYKYMDMAEKGKAEAV